MGPVHVPCGTSRPKSLVHIVVQKTGHGCRHTALLVERFENIPRAVVYPGGWWDTGETPYRYRDQRKDRGSKISHNALVFDRIHVTDRTVLYDGRLGCHDYSTDISFPNPVWKTRLPNTNDTGAKQG